MSFWWPDVPWTRQPPITLFESDVFYCSINLYILVYQNILDTNHVIPIVSEITYLASVVCSIFTDLDREFYLPCKAGEITRYIHGFISKHLPRIPDAWNDYWTTVHQWLPRYEITHKFYFGNSHWMSHIDFVDNNYILFGLNSIEYSTIYIE